MLIHRFVDGPKIQDLHERLRNFQCRLEGGGGPFSANKNGAPEVDRCGTY
jgi:hypothetical protein